MAGEGDQLEPWSGVRHADDGEARGKEGGAEAVRRADAQRAAIFAPWAAP